MKEHPIVCLRLILLEAKEAVKGYNRSKEEIEQLVSRICPIKKANVEETYRIGKSIGQGGCANVFKCTRKSDGKIFVMKLAK